MGPIAGTAIASLLQLCSKFVPQSAALPLNAASAAIAVFVVVIAILLAFVDQNGPEALKEAFAATEAASLLRAEIESLRLNFKWIATLFATSIALRGFVEAELIKGIGEETELHNRFGAMLDVVLGSRAILFCLGDERWNFAIYLPVDGVLRCISCRRRDKSDEEAPHREWPVGTGHVGRAFQENRELVAEDVQSPALQGYFDAAPPLGRPDDADRYRSIAAVPICLGDGPPTGVLIATSDVAGRFKPRAATGDGTDTVEPLRALAAAIAMLTAAARLRQEEQKGHPDV